MFRVTVEDTHGATATATVTVDVEDIQRVGDPRRDVNQATPAECSGYGLTRLTIARANAAAAADYAEENGMDIETDALAYSELRLNADDLYDPEECVCEPGYLGTQCEVHPCGDAWRGELVSYDGANDIADCACGEFFSGRVCDVECFGNGVFVKQGTDEGGRNGEMGTAGVAISEDEIGACVCDPGIRGENLRRRVPRLRRGARDVRVDERARVGFGERRRRRDGRRRQSLDYADQSWVCVCSDDYMGELCDIPCPCARFGLAAGVCEIARPSARPERSQTRSWESARARRRTRARTVPCRARRASRATATAPPVGFEGGISAAVAAIYADITLSPSEKASAVEAARVDGKCFCREEAAIGGWGYYGEDCATPCLPCVHARVRRRRRVRVPPRVCRRRPAISGATETACWRSPRSTPTPSGTGASTSTAFPVCPGTTSRQLGSLRRARAVRHDQRRRGPLQPRADRRRRGGFRIYGIRCGRISSGRVLRVRDAPR